MTFALPEDRMTFATAPISVADGRDWPPRSDWEFDPNSLRDPWLYEVDPVEAADEQRPAPKGVAGKRWRRAAEVGC
jgi:hypothetical protein